ncbi:hypothetical protein BUALT_Bualt19G0111700 [Buddleja alternifolia]|uniref:Uncharacterized protein n=1 Tax=Buddleja alternifolia TaxID=168488 RepID=A0AAV6W373_9LAMI|nr:hypothetical protein BUALT_Bualt19G0111700 [Buddleja alternifolia]
MRITKINGAPYSPAKNNLRRRKLAALLSSNDLNDVHPSSRRNSNSSINPTIHKQNSSPTTAISSPNFTSSSPCSTQPSPYMKSPWANQSSNDYSDDDEHDKCNSFTKYGLIGSIFREEGHIYSLAAAGDLLYTGSDSKNVRVWKNLEDFSGFKSGSGLVKAIVVLGEKIFTGHQDGKIRVWGFSSDDKRSVCKYNRVGNLPMTQDLLTKSINPKNYIEVWRKRHVTWIKHYDAVSCMSVDVDHGLLYSGSWDRTLKVWRISDFKCVESIDAHDDALNSVAVAFDGMVFTGSADGTVKAWRREVAAKRNKFRHVLVETLLRQEHALTSLAVNRAAGTVYAGSSDGLVSFWECENRFMLYGGVLRGHKLAVLCLAVGGNLVLSGSADKSICVWRRDVGGVHACVAVLTGHGGPVKCLAVEEEEGENERWIVYSGSLDKSVKIWRVSEHAPSLKELQEE